MGIWTIKTRGGKKPVMAMVDGELVIIKKAITLGSSQAIILPKEWILALTIRHKQEPVKFALVYNSEVMTIRPYFGKEGQE